MKIILLNFNLRECTEETSFYSDLIFPSFLRHLLSGWTDKSSLCTFLHFLL